MMSYPISLKNDVVASIEEYRVITGALGHVEYRDQTIASMS